MNAERRMMKEKHLPFLHRSAFTLHRFLRVFPPSCWRACVIHSLADSLIGKAFDC